MTDRDPIQALWTNQRSEDFTMSVEEIRARASTLQSTVQKRNFREYAVGAFLIVFFLAAAYFARTPLGQLGCALTAIGVAVVMWRLHVLARAASDAELASAGASWAAFYRQELVRQRDALQGIWTWYLGPLIPGMLIYWIAAGARNAGDVWSWVIAAGGLILTGVVFAWVARLNKQAARALQAEIDTLDASCKG
jgi:hypothetical protein